MNKNKLASMDAVGELPDFGNLLLREGGYLHLVDAAKWNPADTKPRYPCVCETRYFNGFHKKVMTAFQYWTGEYWGFACGAKDQAIENQFYPETSLEINEWREVQP